MAWHQSYLIIKNLLRTHTQMPLRHSTIKHLPFLSIKLLLTHGQGTEEYLWNARVGGKVKINMCYQSERRIEKEAQLLWQENFFSWSHL